MDVLCIFILFKEISDNQAESNIPDLAQAIFQSMECMMVDIDEDAEIFLPGHCIWLSNQQIPLQNLCFNPPKLYRSKLIHQNNVRRRHVLLAGMQDASKEIIVKDLETGNGAPV